MFHEEQRRSYLSAICGAWLETKLRIKSFDQSLCQEMKVDYGVFMEGQRRDFYEFMQKLSFFQVEEYFEELFPFTATAKLNHFLALKSVFSTFEQTRTLDKASSIPPAVPQNELIEKLSLVFEQITGEGYRAELLVKMFKIEHYEDLAEVRVMELIHCEVLDLVQIRQLLCTFKIMSCASLRKMFYRLARPYDGSVLSILGFKYDQGCTLKVLPKDLVLKITHEAAGTNPLGKFMA